MGHGPCTPRRNSIWFCFCNPKFHRRPSIYSKDQAKKCERQMKWHAKWKKEILINFSLAAHRACVCVCVYVALNPKWWHFLLTHSLSDRTFQTQLAILMPILIVLFLRRHTRTLVHSHDSFYYSGAGDIHHNRRLSLSQRVRFCDFYQFNNQTHSHTIELTV